jgi:hypothetical protein
MKIEIHRVYEHPAAYKMTVSSDGEIRHLSGPIMFLLRVAQEDYPGVKIHINI